jgi:hypothetical protein
MNRAPCSEKKSATTRSPLGTGAFAPDPKKLVEFVRALARAAAREDYRKGSEAALPRPEPDEP